MANNYVFMVASLRAWKELDKKLGVSGFIKKHEDSLYILPWMDLTDENSSPDGRLEWIVGQIIKIIDDNQLKNVTVLVHATDIGFRAGRYDYISVKLKGKVEKCIVYHRTTDAYKHLTTPGNIDQGDYLEKLKNILCTEKS